MDRRVSCPKCNKPFAVTTSRAASGFLTQYYGCRKCGVYHGQQPTVIALADVSSTKAAKVS